MPSRSSDISQDAIRNGRSASATPAREQSQATKNTKDKTKEGKAMSAFVEPPLAAQPSYQDHNGGPYGVAEYMQPLGEKPSSKVKARVRPDAPRKSVLGKSSAGGGLNGQETPEGTPAPQAAPETQPGKVTQPEIIIDDEKDGDYAPEGRKKERSTRTRGIKRQSESAPPAAKETPPPPVKAVNPSIEKLAKPTKRVYTPKKLERVVEAAKARAMAVGKPTLAAAVHEVWQESLRNELLTDLLEAILLQKATPEQTAEFQEFVKQAKSRLKDAKNEPRDQPAASTNGTPALPLRSPSKLTSAKPANIEPSPVPSTERTEHAKPKISLKVKSTQQESEERRRRQGQGRKMSVSPRKKRSGSNASESSLTDLTSNDGDAMDVDRDVAPVGSRGGASTKVNGFKGKDHAAERGSLAAPDRKLKRSSAEAEFEDDEREQVLAAKKKKLRETITQDVPYEESDMRRSVKEQPAHLRNSRTKPSSLVPPPISLVPNGSRAGSARGSRAVSADLDSPLSSPSSSRMSTPHVYRGPPKPSGKRAKTKTSPEKKQLAGYSGLSGAGGAGRESPIGDDDNEERYASPTTPLTPHAKRKHDLTIEEQLSDNNDFCSACGGSGFLLCCDGCDRSFHFSCLDPPLGEDASELNEPWFCYICVAKRPVTAEQPEKPQRGLFAPLLNSLRKRNPSNFALPQDVRDYYEGVQADKSGSFIEAVHGKTRTQRGGFGEEQPDYYKNKDSKGNTVLCYSCGKSSMGQRAIIPCDYCGQNWHLDCVDPPLANPPARSYDGRKLHDWMCPLHTDHELRAMDTRLLAPRRKVHVRRPRNAKVIETSLRRGFRNNGIIDVVEDDSDDSDSEFYEDETHDESVVYRLPSSGIKLDFIDKIKDTRVQQLKDERVHKKARTLASTPSALQQANFSRRTFVEKQLALNLAQFATANTDLELGKDRVENLVGTLIAEAPAEVVNQFVAAEDAEKARAATAAIPPSPPSSDQTDQLSAEQRKELEMLQELIKRRLDAGIKRE